MEVARPEAIRQSGGEKAALCRRRSVHREWLVRATVGSVRYCLRLVGRVVSELLEAPLAEVQVEAPELVAGRRLVGVATEHKQAAVVVHETTPWLSGVPRAAESTHLAPYRGVGSLDPSTGCTTVCVCGASSDSSMMSLRYWLPFPPKMNARPRSRLLHTAAKFRCSCAEVGAPVH